MPDDLRRGTGEKLLVSGFGRDLQLPNRALQHGDLGGRVARRLQFVADLVLEVGGIADAVDEEVEEALGRQQTLFLEFVDGLITDGDVRAADMEDHVVVASCRYPLESQPLHRLLLTSSTKGSILDKVEL